MQRCKYACLVSRRYSWKKYDSAVVVVAIASHDTRSTRLCVVSLKNLYYTEPYFSILTK